LLDLNKFIDWVREKSTRRVSIEIGKDVYNPASKELPIKRGISIWAYDSAIGEGQHVMSVDEINLEGKKERQEKEQYERLKAKFEGVGA
jgi:hypothetical protein